MKPTRDWNSLIRRADQISTQSISESSKKTYTSGLKVYKAVMENFKFEPFPITEEKMRGFLMNQVDDDMKYSTIASYISAFSHYFRDNNLDNLTNLISFKNFKSGLRRQLEGDKFPNAKQPFQPEWFQEIIDAIGVNTFDDRLFMFYMTISFCGFLRISELVGLKKSDFEITQNYLSINIATSKTDQFGKGTKTFYRILKMMIKFLQKMNTL